MTMAVYILRDKDNTMKYSMNPLALLLIGALGLLLYSCSTTKELADAGSSANEFFEPIRSPQKLPSNQGRESGRADAPITSRERRESTELETLVREQNLRLKLVLDQLKSADEQTADKRNVFEALERNVLAVEGKRAFSSDREIIDLLKEQNTHLIKVLDQLRVLVLKRSEVRQQSLTQTVQNGSAVQSHQLKKIDTRLAYGRAIKMYQEHHYEQAISALQRLVKRATEEDLADNCRFWTGVSYFHLQRYKEAIPYFQSLLNHPWSEKREGTYIMLGQCYEQIGDPHMAKATFQKLVQLNPVCDLAYVAHVKLSMLQ